MSIPPPPSDRRPPFRFDPPGELPSAEDASGLAEALDGFSIALRALQMVTDAGVAAADHLAADATADEARQGWLASLMALRYTVYHVQFRGKALGRAFEQKLLRG